MNAKDLEEAIRVVISWYSTDVFPEPEPFVVSDREIRAKLNNHISRVSAKMARLTCENILEEAEKIYKERTGR